MKHSLDSGGLKISSIRDVQRWLAEEHIASCSSADAQRIREAVAVLSRPKPRQEDVRPLQSKWQVSHRNRDKKQKSLPDAIQELRDKVIKAAQKLQQQLADNAEQLAVAGSSTDRADVQNEPAAGEDLVLAKLKERQRKRAAETEAEEQRPLAKPKAAKRQNKRTAGSISGSVEPPAAKRKDQPLTAELFAASARDPSELVDPGAASPDSAAQTTGSKAVLTDKDAPPTDELRSVADVKNGSTPMR